MRVTDEILYQHAAEARDIWLAYLPADNEILEHQFSERFERKMRQLIKEQQRSPNVNRVLHYLKRTVVAALAVIVIVFSGLMTVEAYREKVIEIIVQVFNELTSYRFVSSAEDTVLPIVTFDYLPEEMEQTEYHANEMTSYALYENANGDFFEVRLKVIVSGNSSEMILDTEDAITKHIYIHDSEAVIITKNGQSILMWTEQDVIYNVYGNISIDELIKIAENLKILSE